MLSAGLQISPLFRLSPRSPGEGPEPQPPVTALGHVAALQVPDLGVLLPAGPPSTPSSLGISGLIPAPNPSEHPLLLGQGYPSTLHPNLQTGVPKHPTPKPPCRCAPQKAFQAPRVVGRTRAAVPGRWMELR